MTKEDRNHSVRAIEGRKSQLENLEERMSLTRLEHLSPPGTYPMITVPMERTHNRDRALVPASPGRSIAVTPYAYADSHRPAPISSPIREADGPSRSSQPRLHSAMRPSLSYNTVQAPGQQWVDSDEVEDRQLDLLSFHSNTPSRITRALKAFHSMMDAVAKVSNGQVTIVLCGATGGGKTDFLNLFCNFAEGRGPKDFKSFHDTKNERGGSQGESQTLRAKSYTFSFRGASWTFLDPAGLEDTRGIKQDDINAENAIMELSKLPAVNAVVIIANATLTKFTASQKYIARYLLALFPKEIKDSIAVLGTNAKRLTSTLLEESVREEGISPMELVTIENPYSVVLKYHKSDEEYKGSGGMPEDDREEWITDIDTYVLGSLKSLTTLLEAVRIRRPVGTKTFGSLFQSRAALEVRLKQCVEEQQKCLERLADLEQLRADIETEEASKDQLADYYYTRTVEENVPIPSDRHHTICIDCSSTCHRDCSLDPVWKEHVDIKGCVCFDSGKLDDCVGCGHPWNKHFHFYHTLEKRSKTTREELHDQKAAFNKAVDGLRSKEKVLKDVEDDVDVIQANINALKLETRGLWEQYAKNSMGGSYEGFLAAMIHLYQLKIKKTRDPGLKNLWAKDVEELKVKLETVKQFGPSPADSGFASRQQPSGFTADGGGGWGRVSRLLGK